METQRQKKVGELIRNELALIFNGLAKDSSFSGLLISVTKIRVTVDMSEAKAYLSIYPSDKAIDILAEINKSRSFIKHQLSIILKNQLRKTPDIIYYIDDSLDYIEKIDKALKGEDNPIKDYKSSKKIK